MSALVIATLFATPAAQASSSGRSSADSQHSLPNVGLSNWTGGAREAILRPDSSRSGVLGSHQTAATSGDPLVERDRGRVAAVTQRLRHGVSERRRAAWEHADWLGQARAKTAYRERQTRSTPYLKWLRHRWSIRAHKLYNLRLRTLRDFPFTPGGNAWLKAVEEAQRVFPGTGAWLRSCSAAEGGWGRWVRFGGGSYYAGYERTDAVGGPAQYRPSTFRGHFRNAVEYVRERGYRIPLRLSDWLTAWRSALGQALAMGWARWSGNDNAHWSASWSNGCR